MKGQTKCVHLEYGCAVPEQLGQLPLMCVKIMAPKRITQMKSIILIDNIEDMYFNFVLDLFQFGRLIIIINVLKGKMKHNS